MGGDRGAACCGLTKTRQGKAHHVEEPWLPHLHAELWCCSTFRTHQTWAKTEVSAQVQQATLCTCFLQYGAPLSVHPASGSRLPCLVAAVCGATGKHPTQVRPACSLHPSCPSHILPPHPDYMSSLLVSSSRPSSPILSSCRPSHPPCLSIWWCALDVHHVRVSL